MHENARVDFLIVGAQKGGTHALVTFLRKHPRIFIPPVREAHFFDRTRKYQTDLESRCPFATYHELFESAEPGQLWGEATPIYMFLPFVAERIFRYNPAAKLIFLLRNPVHRAYSAYKMERSRQWETWPFTLAVALEPMRLRLATRHLDDDLHPVRVHSYLSRGFYAQQVEGFLRLFPRQNCLFIKSEDLLSEHESTMRRVFGFLEVDADVKVEAERVFVGASGELNPILASALGLLFRRDHARLERLTETEFSDWK
jgi:hypothetical protein